MKDDNKTSAVLIKNNNGISALLILIGILYLLSLIVINPLILPFIYGVNFKKILPEQITTVQILISSTGIILIGIGILGYKFKLFSFLSRSQKLLNFSIIVIILLFGLLIIEYRYRINPDKRTVDFYDASIPYESSIFSINRLPQRSVNVPYLEANQKVAYQLNKGYHGSDFMYKKPEGEIRIVILGGSFIFGDYEDVKLRQGPYNKNWISRIEEKLHKIGLVNVKIINAGIPGHASFDCLGRLFSEIHLFEPDYVILCEAWNDLKYFSKITPKNSLLRLLTPRHIQQREEVEDKLEVSQLYLRAKYKLFNPWDRNMEGFDVNKKDSVISVYSKRQYDLTIDLFVQACKSIKAQPILFTQPRMVHRNNTKEQLKKIRLDFQSLNYEGILDGYAYIDSVILNYPRHDSIVLSHNFAKDFIGVDSLFVDHVHLNAKGSEALSSHLAGYFETLLINK